MKKITPHLWYDKEASEAAELYVSTFENSRINNIFTLSDTPSGKVEMVDASLIGQDFSMISAGPYFKFNPSISFLVECDTKDKVESIWKSLSNNGSSLMDLGSYPFSDKYGWLVDRYGLSWQIMYTNKKQGEQRIIPTFMFTGNVYGLAEPAVEFYASLFRDSKIGEILRYEPTDYPDKAGTVKHINFTLEGIKFAAMDSARQNNISFNESISFIIHCDSQEEIDYYWDKLSADPGAEQCGWLKDKYRISWQVVPNILNEMLTSKDRSKIENVTQALLKMKKFDIAKLKAAYNS